MSKTLLIVFVKNMRLGTVKTRLAKEIGKEGALSIYERLLVITEKAIGVVEADKRVYFSEKIVDTNWKECSKHLQKGIDLGERMQNAFKEGFEDGYDKVILIGSDLPDISNEIIQEGFMQLDNSDLVFGPAEDGGYYLIGMNKMIPSVFINKEWSTDILLRNTLSELQERKRKYALLRELNDIDTLEDLKRTELYSDEL